MTMRLSRQNRDAGLLKVRNITTWAVAGGFAATGFFAGLAAYSGRGQVAARARTRVAGAASGDASSTANGPADDGLSGFGSAPPPQPIAAPSSSGGFGTIVSGAS